MSDQADLSPHVGNEPFPYSDELYAAIGRVTAESALADELLSEILSSAVSDRLHYLFYGMGVETLYRAASQIVKYENHRGRWAEADEAEFLAALAALHSLVPLRNAVVHGTWRLDDVSEEDVRPRPWGGGMEGPDLYYCWRNRYLGEPIEQAFTLADLDELAERFRRGYGRLAVSYASMEAPNTRVNPLPRWVTVDHSGELIPRPRGCLPLLRTLPTNTTHTARRALIWLTPEEP